MGTVPALTDETPLDQYTATASQTEFTFSFMIFATSDIKVYVNDVLKTETTDYVVKQADLSAIVPADDLPMDGGKVVFNSGLTVSDAVSISREIPVDRLTGYSVAGAFRANVLNTELTRMQAINQQLKRDITRSVTLSASDSVGGSLEIPANRASQFLAFDSGGNLTTAAGTIGDSLVVSPFIQTLLDDASALLARATLGLAPTDNFNINDITANDITANDITANDITVNGAFTSSEGVGLFGDPITISNNATDAEHDIDVSAGLMKFDDNTGQVITTALTKQIDNSWFAGNAQGGMDTDAVAADTWYYVYAIYNPTTKATDALFTATYGSPTMPSGFTKKQFIKKIKTDGDSNIIQGYLSDKDTTPEESGYRIRQDGIIEQWMYISNTSVGAFSGVDYNFPITFPNKVLWVDVHEFGGSGNGSIIRVNSWTLSQFNTVRDYWATSVGGFKGVMMQAIGY